MHFVAFRFLLARQSKSRVSADSGQWNQGDKCSFAALPQVGVDGIVKNSVLLCADVHKAEDQAEADAADD